VVAGGGQRALVPMRWGLIPAWWSQPLKEMRLVTFNARSDSIADKPMFAESFARRRCLIPASGYYEWVTTPTGKQPYYFTRRDGQIITIAGIQDVWTDPGNGERLRSCAMVIADANDFVADIHHRMPVILESKDFEQWERGDVKDAAALMKPANDDVLDTRPVSMRVNSSRADASDATLIEAVS
jgi:putative SOS response-associated peptidase YedK